MNCKSTECKHYNPNYSSCMNKDRIFNKDGCKSYVLKTIKDEIAEETAYVNMIAGSMKGNITKETFASKFVECVKKVIYIEQLEAELPLEVPEEEYEGEY